MSSNRVMRPNSRATLNEDKPNPCEVKVNEGKLEPKNGYYKEMAFGFKIRDTNVCATMQGSWGTVEETDS